MSKLELKECNDANGYPPVGCGSQACKDPYSLCGDTAQNSDWQMAQRTSKTDGIVPQPKLVPGKWWKKLA